MKNLICSFAVLLSANIALADDPQFNLNNLPEDFTFVSEGNLGKTTVTYLGRVGENFEVRFDGVLLDGSLETTNAIVNSASQTVEYTAPDWTAIYQPHDCMPTLGDCAYTNVEGDTAYQLISSTIMVDDIWVSEEIILNGDKWLFDSLKCTTYDEFGFWIDYVVVYWDGSKDWEARITPALAEDSEVRIKRLWEACDERD